MPFSMTATRVSRGVTLTRISSLTRRIGKQESWRLIAGDGRAVDLGVLALDARATRVYATPKLRSSSLVSYSGSPITPE